MMTAAEASRATLGWGWSEWGQWSGPCPQVRLQGFDLEILLQMGCEHDYLKVL